MKPGRLMLMEPDPRTSYKYTIWFDYTRKQMTSIKEGDLVAVPNFNSTVTSTTYSILSITSTMPTHYALSGGGNDIKGYPGYVMEAASNLPVDWMDQEDDSFEDTTKIICTAVPIFMEFVDQSGKDIENKRIIPFLSINAGYTINFESSDFQNDKLSLQPKLGLSFYGKKKKSSFLLYTGAFIYNSKVMPSIGIGLGF